MDFKSKPIYRRGNKVKIPGGILCTVLDIDWLNQPEPFYYVRSDNGQMIHAPRPGADFESDSDVFPERDLVGLAID